MEAAETAKRGEIVPRKFSIVDITGAEQRLAELKNIGKILDNVYNNVLQRDTDYGTIPGTSKPSLWKPGGELLCIWLHMVEDTTIATTMENFDPKAPYFGYTAHTVLYSQDGGYLGDGWGAANSREIAFAFRLAYDEKDIPKGLNKDDLLRTKKGAWRVPVEPNETFGQQNSIIKRAKKRAFLDAVLTVTGASRIFTQDIEDDEAPPAANAAPGGQGQGGKLTKENLDFLVKDEIADGRLVTVQNPGGDMFVRIEKNLAAEDFNRLGDTLKDYNGTYDAKARGWKIPAPAT